MPLLPSIRFCLLYVQDFEADAYAIRLPHLLLDQYEYGSVLHELPVEAPLLSRELSQRDLFPQAGEFEIEYCWLCDNDDGPVEPEPSLYENLVFLLGLGNIVFGTLSARCSFNRAVADDVGIKLMMGRNSRGS